MRPDLKYNSPRWHVSDTVDSRNITAQVLTSDFLNRLPCKILDLETSWPRSWIHRKSVTSKLAVQRFAKVRAPLHRVCSECQTRTSNSCPEKHLLSYIHDLGQSEHRPDISPGDCTSKLGRHCPHYPS